MTRHIEPARPLTDTMPYIANERSFPPRIGTEVAIFEYWHSEHGLQRECVPFLDEVTWDRLNRKEGWLFCGEGVLARAAARDTQQPRFVVTWRRYATDCPNPLLLWWRHWPRLIRDALSGKISLRKAWGFVRIGGHNPE